MNETEKLENIFDQLCRSAVKVFHSFGEVKPFIFIFPKEAGPIHVIPINGDKDALALLVRWLCQKVGAFAGAIVSEAWSVTLNKEEIWDGTLPSERLDRVEILQVSLYSRPLSRIKTWKILRNGNARSLEENGEMDADRAESRFFGDYFRTDA